MSGGELLQKLEAIEAGAVAVAEIETQRVVADALEGEDLHVGEILLFAAAVLIAEDILFSARLGAGRSGAQLGSGEIRLGAVVPNDGDFVTDELDVLRRFHDGKIGAWAEPGRLVRHGKMRRRLFSECAQHCAKNAERGNARPGRDAVCAVGGE
jgi:hypothetical protein